MIDETIPDETVPGELPTPEALTTEAAALPAKPERKKREIFAPEFRAKLVAETHEDGRTVEDVAKKYRVRAATISAWRTAAKKEEVRKAKKDAKPGRLASVRPPSHKDAPQGRLELVEVHQARPHHAPAPTANEKTLYAEIGRLTVELEQLKKKFHGSG